MRPNYNNIAIAVSVVFVIWVFYKLSSSTFKQKSELGVDTSASRLGVTKLSQSKNYQLEAAQTTIRELKKKLAMMEMQSEERDQIVAPMKKFSNHKLVHLDLKGAPPKMSYLLHILPVMKKWGATGLLVEYEDTFPYQGDLAILKSSLAYSKEEINQLKEKCKELGLLIIPLVQTFGHMEFVLKHQQFAHLRETIEFTNSVCPINKDSVPLIKKMIDQVLEMHPDLKWFHVGGDEVWNLKTCNQCRADSRNRTQLFVHHMSQVLQHVKSKGLIPLMWDDMMREWDVKDLKALSGIVEPMVWAYSDSIRGYFPPGMWKRYAEAFPKMWAASAFKGAARPDSNYVPVGFHVDNNLDWLRVISSLPKGTQIEGIVLTGWSRFDHYGSLCELLPAGLPSLAFCLAGLSKASITNEVREPIEKELGLPEGFEFYPRKFTEKYKVPGGTFPGHEIFSLANKLEIAMYRLAGIHHFEGAWMLQRQQQQKFLSFHHMDTAVEYLTTAITVLKEVKENVREPLHEIYNEQVVNEWINDKIDEKLAYAQDKLKAMENMRRVAAEASASTT
ncbi:hexosaminidase D [Nematostella vectensis]|uniref:hexosaminidase D n=1 Tax=Nematostella vectensis TaxID=45351 RepID=UPI0020770AB9|nr:hexosaminidase D [Nematostella vectensis]